METRIVRMTRHGVRLLLAGLLTFVLGATAAGQGAEEINPEDYVLRIGDELVVTFYDQSAIEEQQDRMFDVTVALDGTIFLPLVGDVEAKGSTLAQLEQRLRDRLGEIVTNPVVDVRLRKHVAFGAYLIGATVNQGIFPVAEGMTLTQFISLNGGVLPAADVTRVFIVRRNGDRVTVDLTEYFVDGQFNKDVQVHVGDRVFVPEDKEPWTERYLRIAQLFSIVLQSAILIVVATR